MNKLEELKKMLDEVGIECEMFEYEDYFKYKSDGLNIPKLNAQIYYQYNHGDCFCGVPNDDFEKITPFGRHYDLQEAFKRIKYCVENNTDTYVEEETFEVGDVVYTVLGHSITDVEIISCWDDYLEYVSFFGRYEYYLPDGKKETMERPIYEDEFISHSKRKCLEYLYVQSHKSELKEKEIKKDLLKEMEGLDENIK